MIKALVVNDTRGDAHYGCQAVMEGITVFLAKSGIKPIYFQPVSSPWSETPAFFDALSHADICIVNGEGSIHHSNARATELSKLGPFCRFTAKIPAALINASLFENDAKIYRNLENFDLISCRDRASINEAASYGIKAAIYTPDFSFYHSLHEIKNGNRYPSPQNILVGDSVSKRTSRILAEFRTAKGWRPNSIKKDPNRSIYDYAHTIASAKLLLTGRYHAACFSINIGTPFVAIESNTKKISAMLEDIFSTSDRVVSLDELNAGFDPERYAEWTTLELEQLTSFQMKKNGHFLQLASRLSQILPSD